MQRVLLAFAAILSTAMAPWSSAADGSSSATRIPAYISAAVAERSRPAADRERDAARKPAETLAFAGIKPGQLVAELLPGRGYYTRMLAEIVGIHGRLYALVPPPDPNAPEGTMDPSTPVRAIFRDSDYRNLLTVAKLSLDKPRFGLFQRVDVVWTSLNYHDVHNFLGKGGMTAFNKRVFDMLNPGGTYLVIDHAALPGSGDSSSLKLHRIDPELVKKEVIAAGFQLVATSDLLRNPSDPHTISVFDASIRGRTDQFILKFQKPSSASVAARAE